MSMSEELQKRQDVQPDAYTLAWWNSQFQEVLKGYRGATHGINKALAEYEDLGKANEELRGRVKQLETDRESDRAKIGELQVDLKDMLARIERHAEFLTALKRGKPNGG